MFDLPFPQIPIVPLKPFCLRFGNKMLMLDQPKVMGIINLTPDSFFDGSRAKQEDDVLSKASQMLADGADFLDIGGYSTRPGADFVSENEELERVIPTLESIRKAFPESVISIDTFRPKVAKAAVEAGANWVNDVSGGLENAEMLETVASLKVPYIQMHIRKNVSEMHQKQVYDSIEIEVARELNQQISKAAEAGITDIVADPGFGFSKSADQNFQLLGKMEFLHILERPILVGLSRKSMIHKTLNIKPEEALSGTISLQTIALMKGAHILRVHDVKPAVQTIQLWKKLCSPES